MFEDGTSAMRRHSGPRIVALCCLLASIYYTFAILPPAAARVGPGILPDLLPGWYATRVVVFESSSPYTPEVTREIQAEMYQGKALGRDQERFAYPLFATVLFLPLALLPFPLAQTVGLCGAALLTALSVVLWRGILGLAGVSTRYVVLALAAPPVMLGLELRQPTLLVAGLLAVVVACANNGRLLLAGGLGALAMAKPQLAIGVLVPLLLWALGDWRRRKSFLLSFAGSATALLAASQYWVPGWISEWWQTIRAYTGYSGAKPLVCLLPGHYLPLLGGGLLLAAGLVISWKWREADLVLAISFSVAAILVLVPFQLYNQVMLLPGVLWIQARRHLAAGAIRRALLHLVSGLLFLGWATVVIACIARFVYPPALTTLWWFPLIVTWVFPTTLLVYLGVYACAQKPMSAATHGAIGRDLQLGEG